MKIQEEMFALVAEWKSSGQTKKSFLSEKPVSLSKFDYWRAKFDKNRSSSSLTTQNHSSDFRELLMSDAAPEDASKVLELTMPSGLHITVFG